MRIWPNGYFCVLVKLQYICYLFVFEFIICKIAFFQREMIIQNATELAHFWIKKLQKVNLF